MWPMKGPGVQEVRLAPASARHRFERPWSAASVLVTVVLVAVPSLVLAAVVFATPSAVRSPRANDGRTVESPFNFPTRLRPVAVHRPARLRPSAPDRTPARAEG